MRKTSLTRRRSTVSGRGVGFYTWRGIELRMVDDALCALQISELMAQEGGEEKMPRLLRLLFPGELAAELSEAVGQFDASDLGDLVASLMWDAFGMDVTEDRIHGTSWEPPVFDFDEDAGRIRSSLLIAYGMDWDEVCTKLSYSELCDLLGSMLESGVETPFREAVYYRTAEPPKAEKGNRKARDAWLKRKAHFALDSAKPTQDQIARSHNDAMAGMFAAAEKAAMARG